MNEETTQTQKGDKPDVRGSDDIAAQLAQATGLLRDDIGKSRRSEGNQFHSGKE